MRAIIAAMLLMLGQTASAAQPSWTDELSIVKLYADGNVVYFLTPGYSEVCGSSVWIKFSGDVELERRALAVGMMASATGKKMRAFGMSCEGNHLVANAFELIS